MADELKKEEKAARRQALEKTIKTAKENIDSLMKQAAETGKFPLDAQPVHKIQGYLKKIFEACNQIKAEFGDDVRPKDRFYYTTPTENDIQARYGAEIAKIKLKREEKDSLQPRKAISGEDGEKPSVLTHFFNKSDDKLLLEQLKTLKALSDGSPKTPRTPRTPSPDSPVSQVPAGAIAESPRVQLNLPPIPESEDLGIVPVPEDEDDAFKP